MDRENTTSSNKRIVKNTLLLYFRQLFTMLISLYTSRLILDIVGVEDYGIYNIVGGIVVLMAIINTSMADGTQRFITFELGKGDLRLVSKSFSLSMSAHMLIAFIVLFLAETIGLYYVLNYLNIPEGREFSTMITYQLSLLTIITTIIRVPYQASVIAYEKMSFFAYISIFESLLKLVLIFVLAYLGIDKLIGFALLMLLLSLTTTYLYKLYCNKQFSTCFYSLIMDKTYFKKMINFFGWNFVGTISTAGSHQVGNLILNYFFGPVVNAAYGVANQVNSALNSFSLNFQTAFTPQIVKYFSRKELNDMYLLMRRSALLSFYLLYVFSLPLLFEIDFVLKIWLKEVPPYSGVFIILLILYNYIDSLQSPLWKAIIATGNIKYYEIWLNALIILNIPISLLLLLYGAEPYAVLATSVSLNFVSAIIRTFHVKIQLGFPILPYFKDVILKSIIVAALSVCFIFFCCKFFEIRSILHFLIYYFIVCLFTIFIVLTVGLVKSDKLLLLAYVKSKINNVKQYEISQ